MRTTAFRWTKAQRPRAWHPCFAPASSAIAPCGLPATPGELESMDLERPHISLPRLPSSKGGMFTLLPVMEMQMHRFWRANLAANGHPGSDDAPPELLDAAIIFAPVGSLIPLALKAVRKGGTVVCGGIHMSMIPAFE